MVFNPANPTASRTLPRVAMVSGAEMEVLTTLEKDWFEATRDRYLAEAEYELVTDEQDLDRLLGMELLLFRWQIHVANGVDYDGVQVDEVSTGRQMKLMNEQVSKLKESMGMTRKARDASSNMDSVADYLANLKQKAKVFGLHREKQLDKALTLFNELSAIVGAFDRADEEERKKIGFETEADIIAWVRDMALPEYRTIDEHFRANDQRYWVQST